MEYNQEWPSQAIQRKNWIKEDLNQHTLMKRNKVVQIRLMGEFKVPETIHTQISLFFQPTQTQIFLLEF